MRKCIVITGASSGIGKACAEYLSDDNVPEFYSCYATKADCILNQVGNQLLYYGL